MRWSLPLEGLALLARREGALGTGRRWGLELLGTELIRDDEATDRACVGRLGEVISTLILCGAGAIEALWLRRRLRSADASRCGSTLRRRGFSSSTSTRAYWYSASASRCGL